ncbi:unnamed protein product [Linum trigynum]|uniref:Ubiquitin-like domain-containing protein n=1 Tax=Linum trigynum TaxID=586398 RepID=A0AAV2GU68_9ROSI
MSAILNFTAVSRGNPRDRTMNFSGRFRFDQKVKEVKGWIEETFKVKAHRQTLKIMWEPVATETITMLDDEQTLEELNIRAETAPIPPIQLKLTEDHAFGVNLVLKVNGRGFQDHQLVFACSEEVMVFGLKEFLFRKLDLPPGTKINLSFQPEGQPRFPLVNKYRTIISYLVTNNTLVDAQLLSETESAELGRSYDSGSGDDEDDDDPLGERTKWRTSVNRDASSSKGLGGR